MAVTSRAEIAQQSLIGSMLLDPAIIGEALQRVPAAAITTPALNRIYLEISAIYLTGGAVDPVTVAGRLPEELTQTVAELVRVTPTAANWEGYAAQVVDEYTLHRLQAQAGKILSAQSADEARKLFAAVDKIALRPKIRKVSFTEGLSNFLDRQQHPGKFEYLDWGFENVNRHVQCPPHGKFVILGADSSMGKTALALQWAYGFAVKGYRVGFFSLETEERTGFDRIAAQTATVRFQRIKSKSLGAPEIAQVSEEGERHGNICFDFLEAAGSTVDDVRACVLADNYDVIFVDYVQLLSAEGRTRAEMVTNISIQLHTLAQSLHVTVVGLSQITPGETKNAISKDNLRESRQLLQDADVIMLIAKSEGADERRLIIDKNKEGSCGFVRLWFNAEYMRFEPVNSSMRDKPAKKKANPDQVHFEELGDAGKEELPF